MTPPGPKPLFPPGDDDDFKELDAFGGGTFGGEEQPTQMIQARALQAELARPASAAADQERAARLGISYATTAIQPLPRDRVACVVLPSGASVTLDKSVTVIGRNAGVADILVEEDGVSRQHAAILYADGGFFVEDMESSNGTRVNGQKVKIAPLSDGTQFSLGRTALRFTMRPR
jgi:hypothetical protein